MKKALALALAAIMLISAFPAAVFAEDYSIGMYENLQILVAGYSMSFEQEDSYYYQFYTKDSYDRFKQAYNEANSVLCAEGNSEADYERAYDNLKAARESLVKVASDSADDPVTEKNTLAPTDPEQALRESFRKYLYENYYSLSPDDKLIVYGDLGSVDGYEIIYGYTYENPIEGSSVVIGDYNVYSYSPFIENSLFLYKDGQFTKMIFATDDMKINLDKVIELLKKSDDPAYGFKITRLEDMPAVTEPTSPESGELYEAREAIKKLCPGIGGICLLGDCGYSGKLYYEDDPYQVFPWLREFRVGKYTISATSGHTGTSTADDLGLFVVNNGAAYNIVDANAASLVDMDKVCELVNGYSGSSKMLTVFETPAETEPAETAARTPEEIISERYKKVFKAALLGDCGRSGNGAMLYYDISDIAPCDWEWELTAGSCKFHILGGHTGNYEPGDLGLYVIWNGSVFNIVEAAEGNLADMDKVCELIRNYDGLLTFTVEKLADEAATDPTEVLDEFTDARQALKNLVAQKNSDKIKYTPENVYVFRFHLLGDDRYLVKYYLEGVEYIDSMEEIEVGHHKFLDSYPLYEVFDHKNNKLYSLKDAYDNKVIGDLELESALSYMYKPDPETVPPTTQSPTEPSTAGSPTQAPTQSAPTDPTEPPTEAPADARISALKKLVSQTEDCTEDEVNAAYFEPLGGELYLCRYTIDGRAYPEYYAYCSIGAYVYGGGPPFHEIFDYKNNKLYSIDEAYEKGVIGAKKLKKISGMLSDFKLNEITIEPGDLDAEHTMYTLAGKNPKSSDTSVVRITSKGALIGLKKGTAVITAKSAGGKKHSLKVTVKRDPRLKKGKKVVKTVTVKKGKSVRLTVDGIVCTMKMKFSKSKIAKLYRNTKTICDSVFVKGLKRGSATLTLTVNGVKLKLKVKVK